MNDNINTIYIYKSRYDRHRHFYSEVRTIYSAVNNRKRVYLYFCDGNKLFSYFDFEFLYGEYILKDYTSQEEFTIETKYKSYELFDLIYSEVLKLLDYLLEYLYYIKYSRHSSQFLNSELYKIQRNKKEIEQFFSFADNVKTGMVEFLTLL